MTKLIIDGKEIDVPAEYTLLQACEAAGAEIPRFCYHERLSIAGNCRMCLVEVKGGPKPVASCAWGVRDCRPGPKGEPPEISTRSPMVKKAREGVMEFLLINHPLDCPICDQGGECDLQDQAMGYGVDTSRFAENKRAVEDKYLGALVKTSMNRCIQCTRCVRFSAEVAGAPEMGATGRGEDMEITTYLEHALTSELQGNLVDICPVGALTSKPYAFAARPWELGKTQSIDVTDGIGSAIRVDTRGREVMRILPRINEAVNEEWISDKTRHVVDGLRTQRLDRPYIREAGKLRAASWPEAFAAIAAKATRTDGKRIGAIAGDLAGVEEMFALKDLLAKYGSGNLAVQGGDAFDPALGRGSYIFNPTLLGVEQADALLIIGANPRKEAAVFNARIRKRWRAGGFKVGVIGAKDDLTYDYDHLGAGTETLGELAAGKHSFMDVLKNAKNPIILVGAGAASRHDGAAILAAAAKLALDVGALKDGWNGFGVLHESASRVGALDIGFVAGQGGLNAAQMTTFGTLDLLFLLGADEIKPSDGTFVVYIGTQRRPRRASRRRDPAGSRLYREVRDLRQHRRPRADDRPRRVPAGRGPRGLGDCPRAVGGARQEARLRLAFGPAPGDLQGRAASNPSRPDRGRLRRPDQETRGQGRHDGEGAVQAAGRGLLFDQPNRACVRRDGGVFAACLRADADRSGVS
ncbi:NADH-quinone oxidoreductase subunit G [Bradyrhizobium sp. LM3.4]